MSILNIGKYAIQKVVELERPFAPAREFFPDLTEAMLEVCRRELPLGQLTPQVDLPADLMGRTTPSAKRSRISGSWIRS